MSSPETRYLAERWPEHSEFLPVEVLPDPGYYVVERADLGVRWVIYATDQTMQVGDTECRRVDRGLLFPYGTWGEAQPAGTPIQGPYELPPRGRVAPPRTPARLTSIGDA